MKIVCNKDTKRKEIIKLIRHVMIDQDLKRIDVAQRIGGHGTTAYNLLNPDYRPDNTITIDTLVKLCGAVDCDLVLEIRPRDKDSND